ncbi:hypothetical protein F4802DRAFT_620147 [Xylaria palmicola]|nr:hypothetical protein F4802DRAFT_620147 [Xylaria palmicola]
MAAMFRRAGDTLLGKSGQANSQEEGVSLTSVLETAEDRTALTLLVCDIAELMRKRLLGTFDPNEAGAEELDPQTAQEDQGKETDESSGDQQAQQRKLAERRTAELARLEKEVNEVSMVELRNAALGAFDDWRDSVVLRVGEAVNAKKAAEEQSAHAEPETSAMTGSKPSSASPDTGEHDSEVDAVLRGVYPPVKTSLKASDQPRRVLVLHALLLLVLSLEHYSAYSRTLLLHCATSLGLSVRVLSGDEARVARGLLVAAGRISADEEAKERAEGNSAARKLKMGAAGVAGAALIGITGGLAAPLLAAGIGTVLGGVGLGATATAGLLGSLAGSSVLVGGLFGAYGARMSTQAMEKYTRDVEDFAFVPIREHSEDDEAAPHRLRVGIGISGWLRDADDAVLPWVILGDGLEPFALRFEVEALTSLGNSLRTLITSLTWKFAKREVIKRTVFAALMAGLWPMSLTNAGRVIDNPWSVASQRAQKAGEVLADALVNRAQGERPVTLVGYSLGARAIYACLQELARRRAFGLVENVALLGAPTPSSSAEWRRIRAVVAGRVVNAYSAGDYILGFLYRTSSIQFGVAGLQPVRGVTGVENIDVSDLVEGHTLYRHATGPILGRLGFEDVDFQRLKHEERLLREQEREERQKLEEAGSIYQPGNDKKAIMDATHDELKKLEIEGRANKQLEVNASHAGANEESRQGSN